MKLLIGILVVALLAVAIFTSIVTHRNGSASAIQIANLLILSVTLATLIVYAYDTHTIAYVTQRQFQKASLLRTTYEMEATPNEKSDVRTVVRIRNPSALFVRAKIRCNFKVYDEPANCSPDFDGTNTWHVYPQQVNQGWFELDPILSAVEKTTLDMISEANDTNRKSQLTMDLEIHFKDEEGNERKLPRRRHFFDFKDVRWIPEVTVKDDWQME